MDKDWFCHATLLLTFSLLLGCAARSAKPRASLGPGICAPLAAPETGGTSTVARQHFEYEKQGKLFRFQAVAELEADRTALVGLTPVGSRAFSVVFQNGALAFEKLPFYPMPLRPRALLAYYQLMFWPLASLEAHLEGEGIRVVETMDPVHQRRFFHRDRELIRIRYEHHDPWRGKAECWQLMQDFRLTVDTKFREPLDDSG